MQTRKIIFSFFLFLCSSVLYAAPPVYTEEQKNITVTADQPQFTIKLKANPTTGYVWSLGAYNVKQVKLVKHEFVPPTNIKMMGAPGEEFWIFQAIAEGFVTSQSTAIPFSYARRWEPQPAQQIIFEVTFLPLATPMNDAR